jgi:hypothetical protein
MSNNKEDNNTHEKLIEEMLVYLKWGPRFEQFHYKESAVKARQSLRRLRDLCSARYHEIQKKKWEIYGKNQNDDDDNEDLTT